MQAAEVQRQVLSIGLPFYVEDRAVGARGARIINEGYAGLCQERADNFSFWASLPLPHIEASLREIEYAFDQLGATGVTINTFVQHKSIARPEFDPIYAELDRRHAVIFLHPAINALCSPLIAEWGLSVCAGTSMEDSLAAMHLIAARVPERFPRIRFIVPHLGGILPVLLNRLDGQMFRDDLSEPPSVTARRMFYDTVGWGSKAALRAAVEAFGAGQLVPGSDYPVLLGWESYATTFEHIRTAGLTEADTRKILHHNAHRLLDTHANCQVTS
jgi:aminocarboxymuconate-semialdehyde decarboxylase